MSGVSTLWVGCTDHEFARIARAVRSQLDATFLSDLDHVRRDAPSPFVVFAQSRPGLFDGVRIRELCDDWPHSRFLYLLGEWCCGEKRTSQEFVQVPAVYTHQIDDPTNTNQLLAFSRRPDEVVRSGSTYLAQPHAEHALVAIYSPSKSFRNALADAMGQLSMKTVELQLTPGARTIGADFVVWDAAASPSTRREELRVIRGRHPQSHVIALLTYPRNFERESLAAEGVHVLAQPFSLQELSELLRVRQCVSVTSAA